MSLRNSSRNRCYPNPNPNPASADTLLAHGTSTPRAPRGPPSPSRDSRPEPASPWMPIPVEAYRPIQATFLRASGVSPTGKAWARRADRRGTRPGFRATRLADLTGRSVKPLRARVLVCLTHRHQPPRDHRRDRVSRGRTRRMPPSGVSLSFTFSTFSQNQGILLST